jgi:hypothetical protein
LKLGCNPDHELFDVITKNIFFSPQRNLKDKIMHKYHDDLYSQFVTLFNAVYNHELDLELIQYDDKLERLLDMFYQKINRVPKLHQSTIGGRVKYHVIDLENKKISQLKTGKLF